MVAHKQEFTPDQTLLLRSSTDIIAILTQLMSKLESKINSGARTALSVLAAQRPDKPTYEQGGSHQLHGAALEHTIGWGALHPV
jgi:hypothetical protein